MFPARRLASLATSLILAAGIATGICKASSTDHLYEGFRNPPMSARPDVYWWWNGNAVEKTELLRELDVLKRAGIGGVLIFPMAPTMGAVKTSARELPWLSPEWSDALKATIEGARKWGMDVDLLVGTGWPFGGSFLKPGEQIQKVKVVKKELEGPGTFKRNIKDLMVPPGGAYNETTNGLEPKLLFMRLAQKNPDSLKQTVDLTDRVSPDGSVEFRIPDGKHILYIGTLREGFMVVNIPPKGGEGPVLDHFSAKATDSYLAHFEERVKPALGSAFRKLRSLHCDSFEFTGANWTADLPQEFEKRRGYALDPFLPYILDDASPEGAPAFVDAVWRVRDDFWRTVSELFQERFLIPFHQWCHRNGVESRVEAYGCPAMDQLDPQLIADHPMCETWISVERNIPPDQTLIPVDDARGSESMSLWGTMSNKYASSAAHLTGRREVSCETMTNDLSAFRTTLEQVKLGCDLNYVTGVNHPVFHGYNYNPPDAGFPGWFYCGEYFDERNTWWPYFRKVTDYCARLSWVFQSTEPQAELAMIDPLHRLWEPLHQNGYSVDYISESILRSATYTGGKLHYGPNTYDALIMPNVWTISLESAKALERFARAGGKIVFIGQVPRRYPGLRNFADQERAIGETMDAILKMDRNVSFVPSPEKGAPLTWIKDILTHEGISPQVDISRPSPLVYQIHQRDGRRDLFFFANLDHKAHSVFRARFAVGGKTPWRWDPETGKRTVYPYGVRRDDFAIDLGPAESLLLVFEPDMPGVPERTPGMASAYEVKADWSVTFNPVQGKPYARSMTVLTDFARDPDLSGFAGTAVYKGEFTADDAPHRILSLGNVHGISEVSLNGKSLGVRWWGEHSFDIRGLLKPGKNSLEIRVTTVLSNYLRTLSDNPVARIWVSDKNRAVLPAGLIGPVRLL